MSYVSLARKYRPRRFVDMVGQESTTLALTNAIRLRREPHSVIFTGVRGIGKTTSARIYAKALNCEQGPTPDPCDVCASCQAITVGNHEDVLEIDGASNTGVDDVRALQETLSYVPQRSTYKIYIIDEVHMLSISAFNALLKTLEEPPQHVIFIFATTELHKVPETIQSRCQVFHLQKISRPVIAERIRAILHAEEIPFDEAALTIVAREGRGSMRDALTMLDQAIAVGGGQVSVDTLKNMVGGSGQALPVLELLDGLLRKDAALILEVIARWDQEGMAMAGLVEETAKACRNAFILRDLKGQAIDLQILELEDREQQMLLELGEKALPMDLNRLFRLLAKCLDDLRHADLDRFILENYCLEWCFDPGLPDLQTLMNVVSGGQALPPVPSRPVPAATDPSINLRDRWKTSAPAIKSPGSPPAPQASTPAPAPAAPTPQKPAVDNKRPWTNTAAPTKAPEAPQVATPPIATATTPLTKAPSPVGNASPTTNSPFPAPTNNLNAGTPAAPTNNPYAGTPAAPTNNPYASAPAAPTNNSHALAPATSANNPNAATSAALTNNPNVATPAAPANTPYASTPAAPTNNSNAATPAAPANNPYAGTPAAPANNPYAGTPAAPANNPYAGTPAAPANNPYAGTPAAPANNPYAGTPAAPANNPYAGTPAAPANNLYAGTSAAPANNPYVATPAAPANNSYAGTPAAPANNPYAGTPAAPANNPYGGTPAAPSVAASTPFVSDPVSSPIPARNPQMSVPVASPVAAAQNPQASASAQQMSAPATSPLAAAQNPQTSAPAASTVPAAQRPNPVASPIATTQKPASSLAAAQNPQPAAAPKNSPRPPAPQQPPRAGAVMDDEEEMPSWALAASMEGELAKAEAAAPAPVKAPEPAPKPESFLQQMARRAQTVAAATPPPPAPKLETAPPAEAVAPGEPVWPENWRAFVDVWKTQKPLQGRVLEEAYMLEYTPQRIRLAVDPQSMAGGKLLQQDVRKRLMEQFFQLFGFKGVLEAIPKADTNVENNETILTVKQRERDVARENLKTRLEEHPMTREVISRFGGTIEQIELQ